MPADVARRAIPPTVGQVARDTDRHSVLRIGADDLDWLARHLVGLTCEVEVLDPPELVDALRELGRHLAVTGARLTLPADPDSGAASPLGRPAVTAGGRTSRRGVTLAAMSHSRGARWTPTS